MKLYSATEVLNKYQDWSMVDPELLEIAGERGTAVHQYAANYALGLWVPVPEGFEGYCLSFKNWFIQYVVKVIAVEKEFIDESFGILCHVDLIAVLKGDSEPSILDYKTAVTTGKSWTCQTQVYLYEAQKHGIPAKRCGALKLRRDGGAAKYIPTDSDSQALAIFVSALNAHAYFTK